MQRWSELSDVPAGFGPTVVTIGNFDGVHRGHQSVLAQVVEQAHRRSCRGVAITFDPHPLAVLFPERAPTPLTTLEHRLELLAGTGLDAVLVMKFTRELALWSPAQFVEEVLVTALRARAVVVGRDTRFGHRNAGDVQTLRDLGATHGFDVLVIDDLGGAPASRPGSPPPGSGPRWSSTWVRELLGTGDVSVVTEVLGRPHRVSGVVVHGDHRGRELGYPTANLSQDAQGLIPSDGVYAGWLVRLSAEAGQPERLPAAISVGTNPTFDGHQRRVEAYVLDRDDLDLYGELVGIEFVRRLRPTLRFDGIEPLVVQMAKDVEQSRRVLGVHGGSR